MPADGLGLAARLKALLPGLRGRLIEEASMAELTWLRVGGAAEVLFSPADEDDLAAFLAVCPADVPLTMVGVGSNLLVRDGGIKGVVIRLGGKAFGAIDLLPDGLIRAGAAVPDMRLAKAAAEAGRGGLAFYAGIPGAVGGALKMNAGAHGGETKDVMVEVSGLNRQGEGRRLSNAAMNFVYRNSAPAEAMIFTSAVFATKASTVEAELAAVTKIEDTRLATQPVKSRTGGSTFKNPPGHSAWKLIDQAGLRGFRIGGAHMSQMHANFLINDEGASAFDIETLGETVRRRVFAASGIRLDWEIKRIGDFAPGRAVAPAFDN